MKNILLFILLLSLAALAPDAKTPAQDAVASMPAYKRSVKAPDFHPLELINGSPTAILTQAQCDDYHETELDEQKDLASCKSASKSYKELAKRAQTAVGIPHYRQLPAVKFGPKDIKKFRKSQCVSTARTCWTAMIFNEYALNSTTYGERVHTACHEAVHILHNDAFWKYIVFYYLFEHDNGLTKQQQNEIYERLVYCQEQRADIDGAYATDCEHCVREASQRICSETNTSQEAQCFFKKGYASRETLLKIADDLKGHCCPHHKKPVNK